MDDIENYLSSLKEKTDKTIIDEIRKTTSSMTSDEAITYIEHLKHAENYHSNYLKAEQERAKSWNSISKTASPTSVLIYILNATQETFSLAHSSWDNSEFPLEDYEIAPADYMPFILRSEPPKRLGSVKNLFKSTQVKHEFTYKSGEYAFHFSTSLKLGAQYSPFSFDTNYTPLREFSTRSVGKSGLVCLTDIDQRMNMSPYSYAIVINIRN